MLRFTLRLRSHAGVVYGALLFTALVPPPLHAQNAGLQPGEAFVTRFAGVAAGPRGGAVIDVNGTVGSIIGLRAPGGEPMGSHWINEPQRSPVSAGQIGQVFGVALDDARPPNIYVTATSAFGLHRVGNTWMAGMWGQGGGPGTVYRLDAMNNYAPRPFAQITLNGRTNSGPALGNIAYDRYNRQIFVSDLETGMIHRLRAADGTDLGSYDHGANGRPDFLDVETGQRGQLQPIPFDPNSAPHLNDCPGAFSQSPQCWNFATTGRRVWGLAVQRNATGDETRLYYSVWSGPAFDQLQTWNQLSEDDKRNSVWSVKLDGNGNFAGDVRREFIVPDFFSNPKDIARAGYSSPISDIAFAPCGPRPVMLVAERGGIRNLGLTADAPFATPHEARALRYELDRNGAWHAIGRYDVGFYDRSKEGDPLVRANCEGGIAFGLGYNQRWNADAGKPDQFVWITGHSLCSADGPCNAPEGAQAAQPNQGNQPQPAAQTSQPVDDSEVHGVQGMAENLFEPLAPPSEAQQTPADQASQGAGPNQAYLIDTDINIDQNGNVIEEELLRNDATKIGDVAIYEECVAPASYALSNLMQPDAAAAAGGAIPVGYHFRYGSHNPYWSHGRFQSHNPYWSHNLEQSHFRWISRVHDFRPSRLHDTGQSRVHELRLSRVHDVQVSRSHNTEQSRSHSLRESRVHVSSASSYHNTEQSRSHDRRASSSTNHDTRQSSGTSHDARQSRGGTANTHDARQSRSANQNQGTRNNRRTNTNINRNTNRAINRNTGNQRINNNKPNVAIRRTFQPHTPVVRPVAPRVGGGGGFGGGGGGFRHR